jgi:hypothetical protein
VTPGFLSGTPFSLTAGGTLLALFFRTPGYLFGTPAIFWGRRQNRKTVASAFLRLEL